MKVKLNSLVTVTLLLFGGCSFSCGVVAQITDHPRQPYASDKPISESAIFAEGIISAGDFDSHPAFTPDGRTLYFVRSTPDFSLWTILVSQYQDGKWQTPEVAHFSGQY